MIREYKIQFNTPIGIAPALVLEPEIAARATVLVYHGLGAEKEVQRKEMVWLAEGGFRAMGIDAPHHGERADGYLHQMEKQKEPESHYSFLRIVEEAVSEIPSIVDHCLNFDSRVGIAGISLGGYITYAAVPTERRLQAAVPILGSPDWTPKHLKRHEDATTKRAPVHVPHRFPPCAIFAANAGKDVSVPPQDSRKFFRQLKKEYHAAPERLKYAEYPESEHIMREEDWIDLWKDVVLWFQRHL